MSDVCWGVRIQFDTDRIMAQHSREVSEMEQILEEQVLRAQEDSQKKVFVLPCNKLTVYRDWLW